MKNVAHDTPTLDCAPALSAVQRGAIDSLAQWIVERGLAAPSSLFLETVRPMHRLGALALGMFHPLLDAMLPHAGYLALRDALEQPEGIDFLLQRIDHFEEQRS